MISRTRDIRKAAEAARLSVKRIEQALGPMSQYRPDSAARECLQDAASAILQLAKVAELMADEADDISCRFGGERVRS